LRVADRGDRLLGLWLVNMDKVRAYHFLSEMSYWMQRMASRVISELIFSYYFTKLSNSVLNGDIGNYEVWNVELSTRWVLANTYMMLLKNSSEKSRFSSSQPVEAVTFWCR
jgi:hypothetical protein